MTFRTLVRITIIALVAWITMSRPFISSIKKEETQNHSLADSSALEQHVKKLSTDLIPRDYNNHENLLKTAYYVEQEFQKYSEKVYRQTYQVNGHNFSNVISEFGSYNPADGVLVIGAHYDANEALPGADDNASGTAGLIELNRLIAQSPIRYKTYLVAYTLEEPPVYGTKYMGSAYHAYSLKQKGEDVKLMISLEMIGYFTDKPKSQHYPVPFLNLFYPSVGNYIAIVGPFDFSMAARNIKKSFLTTTDLPAYSVNAPSIIPGVDFSDHRNYWHHGYDAVMITDTAFFRNTAYHTKFDTPDRLDYKKMAKVVDGTYAYLSSIGDVE